MTNENEVIDTISTEESFKETVEVLKDIGKANGKKIDMTNKRIDFDKKVLKRLETMLPVYSEETEGNTSELYSYVVRKAVNSLFEGDFKQKLENL